MQSNYNLDFDDEDDDDQELNVNINAQKPSTWNLQDIERLKEQTNSLLDPKWKDSRNHHLIHKMLELEQPTITVKMVDYLLQDNVCETLVSFITQVGDKPRPSPTEQQGEDMKLAYKAVLLLSPDMITDPLNVILTKKAGAITRKLFEIFRKDSAGSFYHAYRVLECLLRCYPTETFDGLYADGKLDDRMTSLWSYIGYPPVCELLVMLVALTPLARTCPLYGQCSKNRWTFLEEISKWNFMLNMAKVICNPHSYCICDSYVSADQHSTAAAQLLQDLTEKISLEDTGDLLLLPYGQSSLLVDQLIDCMVHVTPATPANINNKTEEVEIGLKRSAARLICFLLRRAAESEIVCFVPLAATGNGGNNSNSNVNGPQPTYLPNRLYALRERIVFYIRSRLDEIMNVLIHYDSHYPGGASASASASTKPPPFGVLRQLLVEVLVLMVESDETVATMITLDLWKSLISWSLRYANNNIYHAVFYRLIFAILRQGQESPQKILFQKAKFATFLADNFIAYQVNTTTGVVSISEKLVKDSQNYELKSRRIAVRGLLMNCANAIRLQMNSETTKTFLITFLATNPKWQEFLPLLTTATDLQLQFGLGIEVNNLDGGRDAIRGGGGEAGMMGGGDKSNNFGADEDVDLSTRFARSLGFYDEARWSFDQPSHHRNAALGQHGLDHDLGEDGMLEALSTDPRSPYSPYGFEDSGGHRLSYLANDSDDTMSGAGGLLDIAQQLKLECAFEEEGDGGEGDDEEREGKFPPKAPSMDED